MFVSNPLKCDIENKLNFLIVDTFFYIKRKKRYILFLQ